jgi:nicotinamide-nucleotide amidase
VSITGNAGPGAAEDKAVGLGYVGLAERGRDTRVEMLQLAGDREGIRVRAAKRALYMLWLSLTGRG